MNNFSASLKQVRQKISQQDSSLNIPQQDSSSLNISQQDSSSLNISQQDSSFLNIPEKFENLLASITTCINKNKHIC